MPAAKTEKPPRTVVGVDGSASSPAALRWAVHQAELTGGTVDAVVAWQMPATMTGRGHGGFSGALLGSAGQHCVRHARCPVVIIRGDLARAA